MNTPRRSGLPALQQNADGQGAARTIAPRKSLVNLRQPALDVNGEATPKRTSLQQHMPSISAMPSNATAAEPAKRKLEIGDEVVAEVNQARFTGVLRHLGPVHFRPGMFAGLELTGDSIGMGKNDGSVDGQQYFACEPGNGMFCPATKVKHTSTAPATEATARPRSAMSSRSGRSSVSEMYADRPPSTTPARPRSSMASNSALPRPPSTTPGRPLMRTSISSGRPSSSLATPSAKVPRLLPRRSVADGLADEEGRRRAKTSAEEAAKAEQRITEGSRAHQYLNMSAKELEARRLRMTASGNGVTRATAGRPSSPNKANTSPLKESLIGSGGGNTTRVPPVTPRVRSSMGDASQSTAMATPKAAKGRSSVFAKSIGPGSTAPNPRAMAPPISSGSPAKLAPPTTARTSGAHASSMPRTPSRLSSSHTSGDEGDGDGDGTKARNRSLLEQMALLTPRHAPTELMPTADGEADLSLPVFEGGDAEGEFTAAGLALLPDGEATVDGDAAHAVVPLSLYEESNLEITQLKAQLSEANAAHERAKESHNVERERARMLAQEEIRKEMDEERNVERQDEQRRRKAQLDEREEDWKKKLDGLQKELRKVQDDHGRAATEHESSVRELEARLTEHQTLVETLKRTNAGLEDGQDKTADATAQGPLQAKDVEIEQLTQRVERVEALREQERTLMLKEIDELKDAGQEALDMFDRESSISTARIVELEQNMHLLEAHAQEAIQDAIRERDEALQGGQKRSSVAEISHRSLEEQLSQAQTRAASLEDQLSESSSILQQEREAFVKRKDRYVQGETKLKADLTKLKKHVQQLEEAEAASQQRVEELNDALAESRSALESERSELETLRAEAMIMGDGLDGQAVEAMERSRFEAEVERLSGLLEGARSGKREATRTADALRKQVSEMHGMLDEARAQMDAAKHHTLVVPQSPTNRVFVDESAGGSTAESEIASPSALSRALPPLNGTSPNLSTNDKRFSSTSTHSRRSYTSVGGGSVMSPSDTQAKELAGLRSIVNTLNQELTEVKVNAKQQERELRAQIERYKTEVAQLEDEHQSEKASSGIGAEGARSHDSAASAKVVASKRTSLSEAKLRECEARIVTLQQQLAASEQSKRDEVQKLHQDIAELEALCEATVWRREEQEARRQELERKVAKLERQLDRVQEHENRNTGSTNGATDSALASAVKADKSQPPPAQPQWSHTPFVRSNGGGDGASAASAATTTSIPSSNAAVNAQPDAAVAVTGPCVECNEEGHTIDDCPYLNDDVLF